MYNFTVNFDSAPGKTLYEQLYKYIAKEIRERKISENERMPSKRALASHLGISVNTVEAAYEILVQEGYLRPVDRSGFYVRYTNMPPLNVRTVHGEQEEKREKYRADFGTNAADVAAFPYATWIKLSREVMYSTPELLNAGDVKGDIELRRSIAKYLGEFRGVSCSPSRIIVGAGIDYLLMLLTEILGENRVYALENPGYGKVNRILKNNGCVINYIPLDKNGISVEELGKTASNTAYITPSHQFPMGIIMPFDRREELISWTLEKEDRYIIEDDYNSEFNFSKKPLPALQGIAGGERVIYLNTFSRILAPSIRIAFMVLPPELLDIYEKKFSGYSPTVPRFEQHTLSRFIREDYFARHLNRVKNIYRKRRDLLIETLLKLPYDTEISGEKAGLHLLIKSASAKEMLKKAAENRIRLCDADDYYFTPHKPSNSVIAGYSGVSEEDIELLGRALSGGIR